MSNPHSNPNPSFGFPSPPDSPRTRRTLLRESEESEGTMEIEQYLTSCDPYRSTNLPHFWPYPLMYTRSDELQRTLLPIDDDIRTILRTHGLPEHRHMPFIAQKPHYPGGDTAVKLLYVMLLAEDDHPRRLGPAKDALARLLNEKGVTDMFIEIVNIDLCFQPSLFPMSCEHGLVVGFQERKQRIIDLLQTTLGDSWRLLCPFNVGRVESEARPAVVILVDPLTRANWSGLDAEIRSVLARACQFQTVEVEFIPGIVDFLKDGCFSGQMDTPAMGASVGIRGDTNSSTLGGFVTLTKGDKVLKGFLTNYRVVRPLDKSGPPDKSLTDSDRFGSSWLRETQMNHIEVECFSRIDTQATQTDLDEKISNMDQSIEVVSNKILDREAMGSGSTTGLRMRLDHLKSLVDGWRRERQNVSQMPHLMGEVTAASGHALLGRHIMDWAFVQMTDTAIEQFFRPNLMFPVPEDKQPYLYKAGPMVAPVAGECLTDFGSLVAGNVYLKRGRSTEVTTGLCHGPKACVHWTGKNRIRYDHLGHENDLEATVTEEYIIMSKKVKSSELKQDSFVDDGDSGSFVVDTDGNVCGLIFGGFSGRCGPSSGDNYYVNAGLVTPISDVAKSVRLRTVRKDQYGNITSPPGELGLPGPCT